MSRKLFLFGCVLLALGALPALAAGWPATFDAAVQNVVAKNCKKSVYAEFTLFNCENEPAIYYFTKPSTPAHPGVIKRYITNENGKAYLDTDAHSWGDDAAQPAFIAWMKRVEASLAPRN